MLHLDLRSDAVASLRDGLRGYRTQIERAEHARDARGVAHALMFCHLGLEKALKAALSSVDEALVVRGLTGSDLQRLRKSQREQGAPSLLAVRTKVDTHGATGLLHIAKDVLSPSLADGVFEQFTASLEELVALRNQHVHAEIFGGSAELLGVMTRLLSRIRPIMRSVCPDVYEAWMRSDDQLDSYLLGVEQEIDGAWHVLTEQLRQRGELRISFNAYAFLPKEGGGVDLLMGGRHVLLGGLSTQLVIGPPDVVGFFARTVNDAGARFWRTGGETPSVANLGFGSRLLQTVGPVAFNFNAARRGLATAEDGRLTARGGQARVSVSLADMKPSYLSANARVEELSIEFLAHQEAGTIRGVLAPGVTLGAAPQGERVSLAGNVHLDAEYSYREATEDFPAGTSIRSLEGEITLRLHEPATGPFAPAA